MFAFLSGWRLYALIGLFLVISSLAGALYVQGLRLDSARLRAEQAETHAAQLTENLIEAEADKARMREAQKQLDIAVRERDARFAALQQAKRNLDALYKELKGKVAAEDQACLDRPLPDSLAERLRDSGNRIRQDGNPEDTGSTPKPLPEVATP